MKNIVESIRSMPNVRLCEDCSCKQLTTFKVGGECTAVFPASEDALVSLIDLLYTNKVKFYILGNGSNVVFDDSGYDGAVIVTTDVKELTKDGNRIYASCGAPLHAVCNAAMEGSLSGLQFAYGIPGTVGGAVFMNAGAYDGEIKDVVERVKCYDIESRKILYLKASECGFAYRYSSFQKNGLVILGAEFVLQRGDRDQIKNEMADIISRRKEKQPLNYPSAGSAFKRYPGRYTAKMIDDAGLKGYCCGGAQVSEKHAGFIINTGDATCDDIRSLVNKIKEVIREKEGIQIECEIRFIQ